MHLDLTTSKGENIIINLDYVMVFHDTKKGILVYLNNGNSFCCVNSYASILDAIKKHEKT